MRIQEFDYSVDINAVVLWQYDQATNLLSLLNQKQVWYDVNQTQFWQNWYDNVFNLSSPNINLFGLSVWSIILNVPLFVPSGIVVESDIWGFNAFDPSYPDYINDNVNFDNGIFGDNQIIYLTLQQQQFLLLLKYFNLCNRGTIQTFISANFNESNPVYQNIYDFSINQFFTYLLFNYGAGIGYSGQTIYCIDNLDMTVSYEFSSFSTFPIALLNAITVLDLWPRPAGVKVMLPS